VEDLNNEEFQELVLRELTGIKDKVAGIEDKVAGIDNKVAGIETVQKGIGTRLDSVETRMETMGTRLDRMGTKLESIETRMESMEVRQDEIYRVVKAIEHSNQVGRSEIDSQNIRLAGVEGKLKKVAGVLNEDAGAVGV
jgi:chromosome segregation ATPase